MPPEELTYRASVQAKLDNISSDVKEALAQVRYTNGKVRKIIIGMVFLGGIVIGQVFTNPHDIISLIASAL